jgi:hypothetical protein
MDSKRLTAVLLLLMALAVGFVTAPVLSGEHPWDSDRTNGNDKGIGAGGGNLLKDSVIQPDTATGPSQLVSSVSGTNGWITVLTTAWTVSWSL